MPESGTSTILVSAADTADSADAAARDSQPRTATHPAPDTSTGDRDDQAPVDPPSTTAATPDGASAPDGASSPDGASAVSTGDNTAVSAPAPKAMTRGSSARPAVSNKPAVKPGTRATSAPSDPTPPPATSNVTPRAKRARRAPTTRPEAVTRANPAQNDAAQNEPAQTGVARDTARSGVAALDGVPSDGGRPGGDDDPPGSTAGPALSARSSQRAEVATTTPLPSRRSRLQPGGLRALVADQLRARPNLGYTPSELSNLLDNRSSGAIANACVTLCALGIAVQVKDKPKTYAAAPGSAATTRRR